MPLTSARSDALNPATGQVIGAAAHAGITYIDEALHAAASGYRTWRVFSALDRYKVLRRAGELLRERVEVMSVILTQEQGKPLAEAKVEILLSADVLDWAGEEARHAYGRVIPGWSPQHLSKRAQGTGRSRRRLHALELSYVAGSSKDCACAGCRLLGSCEGGRGYSGLGG